MKILIIGFGSIAKRHINNLIRNINCEIIVYSRRKNIRFLDHKKIMVLNSLEKCLLEKPDVALITNETAFHIPMAIKMAKSGLDLFIEEKEDIRYKTEEEIRNSVKFLTECFGDIPIGDITKEKSNIIKSHIPF